jgi:hypothetical protein
MESILKYGVRDRDNTAVYVLGIIDLLQVWNFKKRGERFFKSLAGAVTSQLSAAPPEEYQPRFCAMVSQMLH